MEQISTVIEYYMELPKHLHFVRIAEQSDQDCGCYRMLSDYGTGSVRILNLHQQVLIVLADFMPLKDFEKVSEIREDYFEISQFETASSSFKVSGRKVKQVDQGICCYANSQKTAYAFCEAGKQTRFTKVIVTRSYFDRFLQDQDGDNYEVSKNALDYLVQNPNSPDLNFVFQQIKDCPAEGKTRNLYVESKVMEILSLITHNLEQEQNRRHLPVKLDKKDKYSLGKAITLMKRNLSAYPSIFQLAQTANMSPSRFQMAFRQFYGTTAYEYLKVLRMNHALLLLHDSDDDIRNVALKVGYRNAGHFSKLFKDTFGMGPKEYRNTHRIK